MTGVHEKVDVFRDVLDSDQPRIPAWSTCKNCVDDYGDRSLDTLLSVDPGDTYSHIEYYCEECEDLTKWVIGSQAYPLDAVPDLLESLKAEWARDEVDPSVTHGGSGRRKHSTSDQLAADGGGRPDRDEDQDREESA